MFVSGLLSVILFPFLFRLVFIASSYSISSCVVKLLTARAQLPSLKRFAYNILVLRTVNPFTAMMSEENDYKKRKI